MINFDKENKRIENIANKSILNYTGWRTKNDLYIFDIDEDYIIKLSNNACVPVVYGISNEDNITLKDFMEDEINDIIEVYETENSLPDINIIFKNKRL